MNYALDDLISIAAAARLREVTEGAIRDLQRRGRISRVIVGGRPFALKSELETLEDQRLTASKKKSSQA